MNKKIKKFLLSVQKPGRYVGGERNTVIKNKKNIDVRFAFCFPDVYEIGMSHLGMKILYSQFNELPYVWCERVFAPWIDMEKVLRDNKIPLFALESGDPVSDFDIIGFTLQYELSYTNVLNMLDLMNVPLRSENRKELKGLVVAGGPCTCNPEPLADFIDLFFLGEGEEVDIEIIELYRTFKREGKSKKEFLLAASQIEGIYVPSLYDVYYNDNGTVKSVIPKNGAPVKIRKRIVMDLDNTYYPKTFVVPLIETVHDRTTSEIFRGCMRGCRFCQAGFIYRPKREKSIETICRDCKNICTSTGYDEISLSSLSSSDYSKITDLISSLFVFTNKNKINISLPSLRVDGFSDDLVSKIKMVRRSGLTFAPEAGVQRLRDVINKNVTEEEIINTVSTAFEGGWNKVKLYFMIGLPTETFQDIEGIPELGKKVVDVYYDVNKNTKNKNILVTISASSFVPKAFTPFQWEAQDDINTIYKKQMHIKSLIKSKKIVFNWHDRFTSFLEGVFARGDRRLCDVLERAQRASCRLDGWSECFDFDRWMNVFNQCSIDPEFYTVRKRAFDEVLPWDHLDYGIDKNFLIDECKKAYNGMTTVNCNNGCAKCGASQFKGGICFEKRKGLV